ncbi:hypothetical protein RB195_014217 [Necator americanus]|uniref:Uncharacterized protein n=1 Tax=Necator americanus TaxID=51031 RepID=A0ABR1DZ57_NECAM
MTEDPWERHCTEHSRNIQSHGVEKEFCGPEKEEKANINSQALENFNNSIAMRNADHVAENILEEKDENKDTVGKIKHFLPHQPVFTPQKDTTEE